MLVIKFTIQLGTRPCCWIDEYRNRLPFRNKGQPHKKLETSIRNDIQTKAIEVNIQSTGNVEEEQIYILLDDEIDQNQLW